MIDSATQECGRLLSLGYLQHKTTTEQSHVRLGVVPSDLGVCGDLKIRDSSTMWGPIIHCRSISRLFPTANQRVSALRAFRVSEQDIRLQHRLDLRDQMRPIRSRISESQAFRVSEQGIRLENRLNLRDQTWPIRSRTSESQVSRLSQQDIRLQKTRSSWSNATDTITNIGITSVPVVWAGYSVTEDSMFVIKCDWYDHEHRNHIYTDSQYKTPIWSQNLTNNWNK
jgi:hypothetical protein